MKKISLMIVDDSAVVRQAFTSLFEKIDDIDVIATASNPHTAAAKLRKVLPDVILLDIEMPRMDGITFMKKLMAQHPIPVVICSSLTETNSEMALEALKSGASEIIHKPKIGVQEFIKESQIIVGDAIRSAAKTTPQRLRRRTVSTKTRTSTPRNTADAVLRATPTKSTLRTTQRIVVIGASTGGTQAIEALLLDLPANAPGIVIVQHMPEGFTTTFARRLNQICRVTVSEASSGDTISQGRVLIAPGNKHTLVKRSGARYYVEVIDGPLVSRHRPSVDVLFRSAAISSGKNTLAIILTGMGSDGAEGMAELKEAGAATIAQDRETSVVFGMPAEAIAKGVIDHVLPIYNISNKILLLT